MDDIFDWADGIVAGTEGGFTNNPQDPGNWTGGRVGAGTLRGTKFGISAAAYPDLDIAALTLADARKLRRDAYWNKIRGAELPPPLALLVYDAAINDGPGRAAQWLQEAAGVTADGVIGPETVAAARQVDPGWRVCAEFLARRLAWQSGLPTWRIFGDGWGRRICSLPWQAMARS